MYGFDDDRYYKHQKYERIIIIIIIIFIGIFIQKINSDKDAIFNISAYLEQKKTFYKF